MAIRAAALAANSPLRQWENLPDEEVMLLVKHGNPEPFNLLLERYRRSLYHYIYRFIPDEGMAEDIFQDAFLRVYKHAARYEPTAKFSTYLYKVATNLCINELKKRKRRHMVPLQEEVKGDTDNECYGEVLADHRDTPDSMLQRTENIHYLRDALDQLPEHQRAVLLLSFYEGLPYEEIAELLDCSVGTVKSRVHRAKKAIAKILKDNGIF